MRQPFFLLLFTNIGRHVKILGCRFITFLRMECNFMEITKDLVQYLESLGRLELSPEDEEKTQKALGDILGYFDQLSELDTEGVEPLSHVAGVSNVTREDVIANEDMRDAVLSNAPETKDGTILVPKTFD